MLPGEGEVLEEVAKLLGVAIDGAVGGEHDEADPVGDVHDVGVEERLTVEGREAELQPRLGGTDGGHGVDKVNEEEKIHGVDLVRLGLTKRGW